MGVPGEGEGDGDGFAGGGGNGGGGGGGGGLCTGGGGGGGDAFGVGDRDGIGVSLKFPAESSPTPDSICTVLQTVPGNGMLPGVTPHVPSQSLLNLKSEADRANAHRPPSGMTTDNH